MRIDSSVVEPFDFAAFGARQPTSRARVLEVRIQSSPAVSRQTISSLAAEPGMIAREQRSAPTYFTLKSCSNSSSMTASIGPVAIVGGSVLPMANALTSVNRKDASGAEFIGRIPRGRGVMADSRKQLSPASLHQKSAPAFPAPG